MMVHRNPDLAKVMFPFRKRLGIDDYMKGKPNEDGKIHLKIDEEFLKKELKPKTRMMRRSKEYLEYNDYKIDFKKIRRTFEGVLWR
jgi:hypothetical protein